jgi:hypothetical protein
VTGDGLDDAIFTTFCTPGNFTAEELEVWEGGDEPAQLPTVLHFFRDGTVDRVEAVDGRLRVNSSETATPDGMEHLHGYLLEVVTDYEWSDETWVATEIERTDTRPSPSPQSEVVGRFTDPQAPHIRDAFQLPSGNIYCGVIDYESSEFPPYLDCVIFSGLNPIPRDEYCDFDWVGIYLPMQGSAGPDCRSDTWVTGRSPDTFPVLGYGQTWAYDEITCRSSEAGLSCENRSGGAFSLSRSGWAAR